MVANMTSRMANGRMDDAWAAANDSNVTTNSHSPMQSQIIHAQSPMHQNQMQFHVPYPQQQMMQQMQMQQHQTAAMAQISTATATATATNSINSNSRLGVFLAATATADSRPWHCSWWKLHDDDDDGQWRSKSHAHGSVRINWFLILTQQSTVPSAMAQMRQHKMAAMVQISMATTTATATNNINSSSNSNSNNNK
jgi:hypothetical protein